MGKERTSHAAYTGYKAKAESDGGATRKAETQFRSSGTINELVDPSKRFDVRGKSSMYLELLGGTPPRYVLKRGVPMPTETVVDTTGSMGENLDIILNVIGNTYSFLTTGKKPLLDRYDAQFCIGEFGDYKDPVTYMSTMYESDFKVLVQLAMMVPNRAGQDFTEDPIVALFAAAYLRQLDITKYGLKGYHFTVSDADTRFEIASSTLTKVFGAKIYEELAKRGFGNITARNIPDGAEIVKQMKKNYHQFFLQVGSESVTTRCWERLYGEDRVVTLKHSRFLPYTQAAIIGLSEGILDLQTVVDFLREDQSAGGYEQTALSLDDAEDIRDSVVHIPMRAQAKLPNFNKIPTKLSVFANETDLWPIEGENFSSVAGSAAEEDGWL